MDVSSLDGKTRELIEGVWRKRGTLPPLMLTLANSPAAFGGYLAFGGAMGRGALSEQLRERIAIAVAEANGCRHCLAAHTRYGREAGLAEEELVAARSYDSADPKAQAALTFSRTLQETRGHVPDAALTAVRAAGFDDGEIVEIAAVVAINAFTNYVNNLGEESSR